VLTVDTYVDLGYYHSYITTNISGVGPFKATPSQITVAAGLSYPITGPGTAASPDPTACQGPLNDLTGEIAVCDINTTTTCSCIY